MGTKLSHELLDRGFFSALGTSEHPGAAYGPGVLVVRGTPYTFDHNNGTTVVYDEVGRPWIKKTDGMESERLRKWANENRVELKYGAYVPHSNDGGCFMSEVVGKL
jgi:hypothetical protein